MLSIPKDAFECLREKNLHPRAIFSTNQNLYS